MTIQTIPATKASGDDLVLLVARGQTPIKWESGEAPVGVTLGAIVFDPEVKQQLQCETWRSAAPGLHPVLVVDPERPFGGLIDCIRLKDLAWNLGKDCRLDIGAKELAAFRAYIAPELVFFTVITINEVKDWASYPALVVPPQEQEPNETPTD